VGGVRALRLEPIPVGVYAREYGRRRHAVAGVEQHLLDGA
jgi:hypothetical protein